MSKNITYQTKKIVDEQESVVVAKHRNTERLMTDLEDGSLCYWIPEDETKLITKVITTDGTYIASKEPGSPYGYSQVTVSGVGNKVLGDLGTITITKNGTYYAKKDKNGPFYGYRAVVVNISGGESSGGGSVTGTDSSGNKVNYKVDEQGNLVCTNVATQIQITETPTFLVYKNGDTINYSGIEVTAYAGSSIYVNSSYPNGVIPFKKLIFPVTTASGGNGQLVSIPVQWKRPEDGATLEISFSITVNNS